MFTPEDPLSPPATQFDEAWQAQALALADALVQAGLITPAEWSHSLGAELAQAAADDLPDTTQTYYAAIVSALEQLVDRKDLVSAADRMVRRGEWENAYRSTPHGHPVELPESKT